MPPVKETVSGGFGKVLGENVRDSRKVGNGAGYFDNTGIGAGAEALAVNDFLQKLLTGGR